MKICSTLVVVKTSLWGTCSTTVSFYMRRCTSVLPASGKLPPSSRSNTTSQVFSYRTTEHLEPTDMGKIVLVAVKVKYKTQYGRTRLSYRNVIAGPMNLVESTRVHRPTGDSRKTKSQNATKIHQTMDPHTKRTATKHAIEEDTTGIQGRQTSTPPQTRIMTRQHSGTQKSPPNGQEEYKVYFLNVVRHLNCPMRQNDSTNEKKENETEDKGKMGTVSINVMNYRTAL